MPVPDRSRVPRFGAAITKYRISGNASEKMKNRRLRKTRTSS